MLDFTGIKQHKSIHFSHVKFANTVRCKYFCQVLRWGDFIQTPFPDKESLTILTLWQAKSTHFS
jgi:hypothetical protein